MSTYQGEPGDTMSRFYRQMGDPSAEVARRAQQAGAETEALATRSLAKARAGAALQDSPGYAPGDPEQFANLPNLLAPWELRAQQPSGFMSPYHYQLGLYQSALARLLGDQWNLLNSGAPYGGGQ